MSKPRRKTAPPSPTPLAPLPQWARLVEAPDGTLQAFAVREADGSQQIARWRSSDGGASWGEAEPLVALPPRGRWDGVEALVDRDGEIHVFMLNAVREELLDKQAGEEGHPDVEPGAHLDIWHLRSRGARREWPAPRKIWSGYTGALNSVTQLRSGRIVLPFSYLVRRTWDRRGEGLDAFTFMGRFMSTVVYSDDAGETWRLSPTPLKVPVPDITYAYGAVEPVVLELRDGRAWMLIRTQMGRFYESHSADGASWSPPRPSAIVSSDSPAGLARLADGRLALLWNNCLRHPYAYGGRQVIHAAVSDDEGLTWRGWREVARDPLRNEPPPPSGDHGTAYPFPTALRDGSLVFTTGQGSGRVQLMRLDPAWLTETGQDDDFSQGLDAWSIFGTKGVELVARPDAPRRHALRLARCDAEFPACAVRNFPLAAAGRLRLEFRAKPGCGPVSFTLTDHFSPPFDDEAELHGLGTLRLDPAAEGGADGSRLRTLTLAWDVARGRCRVSVDGRPAAPLPLLRRGPGACYVRIRCASDEVRTAGIVIGSVRVRGVR